MKDSNLCLSLLDLSFVLLDDLLLAVELILEAGDHGGEVAAGGHDILGTTLLFKTFLQGYDGQGQLSIPKLYASLKGALLEHGARA